jgi:hypothetical protein
MNFAAMAEGPLKNSGDIHFMLQHSCHSASTVSMPTTGRMVASWRR